MFGVEKGIDIISDSTTKISGESGTDVTLSLLLPAANDTGVRLLFWTAAFIASISWLILRISENSESTLLSISE